MIIRTIALSLAAAAAMLAFSAPAQATTQALALVKSGGPIELACYGRTCGAEFTSFCLQPERRSPTQDTRYELAGVQDIKLVGHRADGSRVVLDAAKELEIRALRTHVAVRLSVPRARLNELDLDKVTVEVGEKVALLPFPGTDEVPMSASEVVAVKTSLRTLGAMLVDNDRTSMQAVRLVNRMVNALPPGGRVAMSVREKIWKQTIRPEDLATAPPSAKELLQQAYDHCTYGAKHSLQPSMRHCLQSEHDAMLSKLNGTYWDAVKNGS